MIRSTRRTRRAAAVRLSGRLADAGLLAPGSVVRWLDVHPDADGFDGPGFCLVTADDMVLLGVSGPQAAATVARMVRASKPRKPRAPPPTPAEVLAVLRTVLGLVGPAVEAGRAMADGLRRRK